MVNSELIVIKEGQVFCGRKRISAETGIPETTIERVLDLLENGHYIGQQKTTKYRVITILNWKEYQSRTAKRTTNGQQADTYKNVKECKEDIVAPKVATLRKPKKEKIDPKTPIEWATYLKNMEESKHEHIQLIAYYFTCRQLKFDTQGEVDEAIARHIKAASKVVKFQKNKVLKAIKECERRKDEIDWTLETVLKMLTKNNYELQR